MIYTQRANIRNEGLPNSNSPGVSWGRYPACCYECVGLSASKNSFNASENSFSIDRRRETMKREKNENIGLCHWPGPISYGPHFVLALTILDFWCARSIMNHSDLALVCRLSVVRRNTIQTAVSYGWMMNHFYRLTSCHQWHSLFRCCYGLLFTGVFTLPRSVVILVGQQVTYT